MQAINSPLFGKMRLRTDGLPINAESTIEAREIYAHRTQFG